MEPLKGKKRLESGRRVFTMSNLVLIPARGGSTRVNNKNIRELCGKPLVAYTIESAIKSGCGRVVVSTNSEEIAIVARSLGAETPFMRPDNLSTATASSASSIYHALDWFKEHEKWLPDMVIFCPPSNPFRKAQTISGMVKKISGYPKVNSIVTIVEPATHPFRIIREEKDGKFKNGVISIDNKNINDFERTQDWPKVWEGSPACRITRSVYFMDLGNREKNNKTYDIDNFIGCEIPPIEAFDIDSEENFALAEFYCSRK